MGKQSSAPRDFAILGFIFALLIGSTFWSTQGQAETQAAGMSTRNRIKIKKKSYLENAGQNDTEEYSAEKMELLTAKRRALMLDIRKFLREAHSQDQKSELNLRLGALYMEDYHAGLAKAQQTFEKQQTAYKAGKNKRMKPPKFDSSEAMESLEKARSIYKDLLARDPNNPRRDEVYYFLATSSLDKGKIDEGMGYFTMLSEKAPTSRFINDALIQLGDYYFESNRFPQAEGYYDKIIAKKYIPLIPYSTYKKAWCRYNQGQTQVALQYFKWVIENENEENSSAVKIKGEALKDITLPFTDLKMVNESIVFFQAQGDPYYRHGLETMSDLYFESGQYDNAIVMYQHLLALDPNYVKNPAYDVSYVEALRMKHQDGPAVDRLFAQLPVYAKDSTWFEINSSNAQAINDATTQFEEIAWKYGTEFHAQAQRTKSAELYNLAKKVYANYLQYFPRTARAPKVRFELAEISYKQGFYVEAADNYYQVYKMPTAGSLRLDSIKDALMSLDRQLNLDRRKLGLAEINIKTTGKLKESEDTNLELVAYTDVENKFLNISEEYLESFPKQKDSPDVIYECAYLQYMHHDFSKSYKNFWTLVQTYPQHETAYPSAYLILDILNRRKDYDKLVAACKKFLEQAALSRADFRTEVADILRHGELKRIQIVENGGSFKDAADQYVEYTKEYGHQDEALFEKALYNASVDYTKASQFLRAVETQEQFLRRFPKSTLRENMFLQVAKTYELFANFEKAAYYFEEFSNTYPSNPQAKSAMRLAGLYYWGAGNNDRGETVMLRYMKLHPEDRKIEEKDLLDLYETEGNIDKEVGYYMRLRGERGVPASDYIAATLKIAEIDAKRTGAIPAKLMEESLKAAENYSRELVSSPKGVESLAKLRFWAASRREESFNAIKLTLPQKQLEINLQRKLSLMRDLEHEYARVAGLGSGEWGLGAIYKTALVYHRMAQEIQQAPVPSELNGEQVDLYRDQINKTFLKPFNDKALSMAAQCLDKAQELNLLSSWTSKCYSLAGDIDPQRYPVVRTFYLPPLQMSLMLPNVKTARIPVGNIKQYAYPFFSFGLFTIPDPRGVASAPPDATILFGNPSTGLDGPPGAVPTSINYRTLSAERQQILTNALNSEKPSDPKAPYSFAYLNLLRLLAPQRALTLIQSAIQRDPQSQPLHNLLGLTYLQMGKFGAAKVSWLSMVAQGTKNGAIWNNLGVLAAMQGREPTAIDLFSEATLMNLPHEALNNLGFIALKYRNGFEAKKQFEQASQIDKSEVTTQVGYAIALLQNNELDLAKDKLVDLNRKYKTDPYSRLSLGYFLIDVEKENDLATRILGEYVEQQQLENDLQFRQALQEAKHQKTNIGDELPNIQ